MNVGLDELRPMGRARRQLPRLLEKRRGLVDPHDMAGPQGEQRQAFAAVVAAQLHHVLAVDPDLLQHTAQRVVDAAEIAQCHGLQQGRPFGIVFVVSGGVIPRIAVAGDGFFFGQHFHCTLQNSGLSDRPESRSAFLKNPCGVCWNVVSRQRPRTAAIVNGLGELRDNRFRRCCHETHRFDAVAHLLPDRHHGGSRG
ncbi:hypothetical protein D3C84_741610 [compost metagenome]